MASAASCSPGVSSSATGHAGASRSSPRFSGSSYCSSPWPPSGRSFVERPAAPYRRRRRARGPHDTIRIAEQGHAVDLFSLVRVSRSHSVCAQGGINGAVNTKGEGDSPWKHFDDTVYGGDFLANQPPVQKMCEMAPAIIYLFDRMGVPFSRSEEH